MMGHTNWIELFFTCNKLRHRDVVMDALECRIFLSLFIFIFPVVFVSALLV